MDFWKKCNSCKKPLPFEGNYWVCNVSTCNRKRTGLSFCSVECWDAHLAVVSHRESWAEEKKAPSRAHWEKVLKGEADLEPKKEKAAPVAAPPPASGPKIIIRRK